jgi:hypothetical protein
MKDCSSGGLKVKPEKGKVTIVYSAPNGKVNESVFAVRVLSHQV